VKRAFGALGTLIAAGGCAAAVPVLASILAAVLGMLTVVGVYAWRIVRRRQT
jgi:hypothetical protein